MPRSPSGWPKRSVLRSSQMPELFLGLSARDRAAALGVAVSRSGRPAHILEKDIWVVWTPGALFESAFAEHLVFKGGTSLSKVYKAIRRFRRISMSPTTFVRSPPNWSKGLPKRFRPHVASRADGRR